MIIIKYLNEYEELGVKMTTSIEKIQKVGDRAYIITIFLMAVLVILTAAVIAVAVMVMLNADVLSEVIDKAIAEYNISRELLAAVLVLGAAMLVVTTIAVFFASKLFNDLRKSHTPFKTEYAKAMKLISIIVIVAGLITLSIGMICIAVLLYFFSLVFEYGIELQQASDETL